MSVNSEIVQRTFLALSLPIKGDDIFVLFQCTRECGGGIQFRSVLCLGGQSCLLSEEPAFQRTCNTHPCTTPSPTSVSYLTSSSTSSSSTISATTQQHLRATTLPTTKSSNDLQNLKIKSPTENSSIKKPESNTDITVQSVTPQQNSSEDTEYYYYYYYDEDDDDEAEEPEFQGSLPQFKWIPLTWGEVRHNFKSILFQ